MARAGVTRFGDWKKSQAILSRGSTRMAIAAGKGVQKMAQRAVKDMRQQFNDSQPMVGNWDANHPWTLLLKGSSKPLVDDADLRNSITSEKLGMMSYSVGVSRNSPDMANIGAIMEFGATIDVSDKMRRWLHANGMHLKPGTTAIVIPARPFVEPVRKYHEQHGDVMEGIMKTTLAAALGMPVI